MQQRVSLIGCCPVLEGDWRKVKGSTEASSTELNKLKLRTFVFKKSSRWGFVFSNPSDVLYDSFMTPHTYFKLRKTFLYFTHKYRLVPDITEEF